MQKVEVIVNNYKTRVIFPPPPPSLKQQQRLTWIETGGFQKYIMWAGKNKTLYLHNLFIRLFHLFHDFFPFPRRLWQYVWGLSDLWRECVCQWMLWRAHVQWCPQSQVWRWNSYWIREVVYQHGMSSFLWRLWVRKL